MRDELPPVGQDRQRQRLAVIRIVDPHQTRMDGKARRLDYTDNLPESGYEAPVLTKHCPTVTGMPNLQTHSAGR